MFLFENETVDEILCEHVLEHIPDTLIAMREFHRVLKPSGLLKILSPHALNHNLFSTPDHYKGFTYTTFNQFWQDSHINYPKFTCQKRQLILRNKRWQFLADRYPIKTESLYWLFEPSEIYVELVRI